MGLLNFLSHLAATTAFVFFHEGKKFVGSHSLTELIDVDCLYFFSFLQIVAVFFCMQQKYDLLVTVGCFQIGIVSVFLFLTIFFVFI